MLKAMLLVIILSSGGEYFAAEMPSMKECLDTRIKLLEQNVTTNTLCLPMVNDPAKIQEFLVMYMTLTTQKL